MPKRYPPHSASRAGRSRRSNTSGSMLMDRAEATIGERSPIAGLGVGLFSDYGAAQVLYGKRGYIPDGNGIYWNDAYVRYGEQVVADDDLNLFLVKMLR
ncbi:hypothetical protein [Paenibacillus cymbidii]|uniref:hypothetical protein n=1 Tax=Paenibacillus cymbidii TaxID=1639034 RepID=UPI0010802D2D|nr:hypothetical protein [Paenibacillus cymbidii]